MNQAGDANPFAALGLAARPDLADDDVRAAWRRIAAATHPDRADGGDPDRFAMAAAAYTVLRTRYGRGEALADLADLADSTARRARPGPDQHSPGPGRPAQATPEGRWPGTDRTGHPAPDGRQPGPGGTGHPGPDGRWPGAAGLLSRIRRGRVARLGLRVLIAAAVSAGAAVVAGAQPAAPALIVGAITWLLVTAKNDLAPPS